MKERTSKLRSSIASSIGTNKSAQFEQLVENSKENNSDEEYYPVREAGYSVNRLDTDKWLRSIERKLVGDSQGVNIVLFLPNGKCFTNYKVTFGVKDGYITLFGDKSKDISILTTAVEIELGPGKEWGEIQKKFKEFLIDIHQMEPDTLQTVMNNLARTSNQNFVKLTWSTSEMEKERIIRFFKREDVYDFYAYVMHQQVISSIRDENKGDVDQYLLSIGQAPIMERDDESNSIV